MVQLSVIIPHYREPFLDKTIESLKTNSAGEIEILPIDSSGMRTAINEGVVKASGKFIMKCDAHCIFAPGFDKVLTDDCQDDWLMIPRRYSIDFDNWTKSEGKPPIDYHYLEYPWLYGRNWYRRKSDKDIDDTMSFQGSCWVANREYFIEHIGSLNIDEYGPFNCEYVELGMKYWLGGGEVKVNKKTWYGHLCKRPHHYRKGMFTRKYKRDADIKKSFAWASDHWIGDKEPNMVRPFSWLIEKFSPIPGWPA